MINNLYKNIYSNLYYLINIIPKNYLINNIFTIFYSSDLTKEK